MTSYRFVFIVSIVLCLAPFAGSHAAGKEPKRPKQSADKAIRPVDRIMVVVNDGVITERELETRLEAISQQLQKQGTPLPPKEIFSRQMLERLILETLQLHYE